MSMCGHCEGIMGMSEDIVYLVSARDESEDIM